MRAFANRSSTRPGGQSPRLAIFAKLVIVGVATAMGAATSSAADAAEGEEGFTAIFDGKTLEGWEGDERFWRVEDGAIVGQTTEDNPTEKNTFLIWRGGTVGDFELRFEYRIDGGNSGVQYRSWTDEEQWGKYVVGGYQADIDATNRYTGILYGEKFRGILGMRGDKVVIGDNHKPRVVESFAESSELASAVKSGWNEYRIVGEGFKFQHYINGTLMVEVVDEDEEMRRSDGIVALQVHRGPPMKVEYRKLRVKNLGAADGNGAAPSPEDSSSADRLELKQTAKIVFVAGPKSHGFGAHEHYAGCKLLAKCLREAMPSLEPVVYRDGWPDDPKAFEGVDAIVVYADGGGRHPLNDYLDEVDAMMADGVGLVCIHYAVEVPLGKANNLMRDWTGGCFEQHWSVNPHWEAHFKEFPEHPVACGLEPFHMHDEWYYHMRFRDEMEGVTPILTAIPPDSTRERRDGPHSNNPTVRSRKGMPEHVAWARQRPDGGRGVGFTGGHFHWNWAHDEFRTTVLNGIVWSAGLNVPEGGVATKTPTLDDLLENQDYPKPENFNLEALKEKLAAFETEVNR